MAQRGEIGILACKAARPFAERIATSIRERYAEMLPQGISVISSKETTFSNGEVKQTIEQHIAGMDIYAVQLHEDPADRANISCNDRLMALLALLNAANYARAQHITAVVPVFPYQRQDKIKTPKDTTVREPLMARVASECMEAAGATGILTMDLHAQQIQGYTRSVKNLVIPMFASSIILPYIDTLIKEHIPQLPRVQNIGSDISDIVRLGTPDASGAARVDWYTKKLGIRSVGSGKVRGSDGKVEELYITGDVKDKVIIVIDDMIDTAGSIEKLTELYAREGAIGAYLICTHPILNPPAEEKLRRMHKEGRILGVAGTNTVHHSEKFLERNKEWLTILPVYDLFADAIVRLNTNESLAALNERPYSAGNGQ